MKPPSAERPIIEAGKYNGPSQQELPMREIEELVQTFVGVWNECDPARRRATIESLWATDGRHYMGAHDVGGYDALEARVAASNQRNVADGGAIFRPATVLQTLPGVVKFRWDMTKRGSEEVLSAGVGFLRFDSEGKIIADYLFAET
jgi:hypothetical protein